MSDEIIRLEPGDVRVQEIPADECGECAGGPATHVVMVDFRSAGMEQELGRYCRACAKQLAERIRDGLR